MPWKKKNTRTEIVHIVVTGYQKKKMPSKHYVFVIDVTWNSSERFEVYRRYSDFFSFQTMLKALFPGAAGRRKSTNEERIIPQLPKRIFVGRSHVAKVAEARQEQINRYCQTLISLDPRISESAHVVGFFSPRKGDKELPKLHLHQPASLHPTKIPIGDVFEEYCALAEYVAEDASQVNFQPGDKVLVLSKDESGWWMCSVDGCIGWAPPSYLKKCEGKMEDIESDDSDEEFLGDMMSQKDKDSDDSGVGDQSASEPSTPASAAIDGFLAPEIEAQAYKAIDSYQAEGPGQVSFEVGDVIHVLDKLEDGWWFVSNGQEEGWAPCSYLEGDQEEEIVTNLDVEKYCTVDDYKAEEDDEISFSKGLTIDVLQKSLDGWWIVKLGDVVGLAPATFLKKLETQDTSSSPNVERKFTPPSSSLSPLHTFQQPPRRVSVKARASMTDRPVRKPSSKNSLSLLSSIATDPPYMPTPAEKQKHINPVSKPEPRKPRMAKKPNTPELSDSDPDDTYINCSFERLSVQAPGSPHNKQNRRASKNSESESPAEDGGKLKPPIATPRKQKPVIPPKKSLENRSLSLDNTLSGRPPLPPRPNDPTKSQAIPNIKKHKSVEEDTPTRPDKRPRKSEIKKAKERARQMKKSTPALSIVDEDERMSVSSSRSTNSSNSYTSSKSAPSDARKNPAVKKRSETTLSDDPDRANLLTPERPRRIRRKSAGDTTDQSAAASPCQGEKLLEGGGINTQVAESLLRCILSSEDENLKDALRDLITKDSEALTRIH